VYNGEGKTRKMAKRPGIIILVCAMTGDEIVRLSREEKKKKQENFL